MLIPVLITAFSGNLNAQQGSWKLGVQAYSFRNGSFFQAVALVKGLGLKYIEAYPQQLIGGGLTGTMDFHMSPATRSKILKQLKQQGVTLISYGVVNAHTPADWKLLFEFAKAMGLPEIVSEPADDQIPLVSRLAGEYHIRVAIHDEPRPDHYWTPDSVLAVLKHASTMVGDCADIGHWAYSGLNVVDCLKKMHGRIMELHFKDVGNQEPSKPETNVVWGTGLVNVKAAMQELKRQHFHGMIIIEYENNPGSNIPQIKESIAYYRKTLKSI